MTDEVVMCKHNVSFDGCAECSRGYEQPAPSPSESAEEWIGNLPDNPLYKRGILHYPPRGLRDIAGLCDAYARQHIQELERENATLRQIVSELAKIEPVRRRGIMYSEVWACDLCGSAWPINGEAVHQEDCLIRRAQEAIKP